MTHRAAIAALYFFMENGGSQADTPVVAARAYLLLSQLPGSAAHRVHNVMLLRRIAILLERWPDDASAAPPRAETKRKVRSPPAARKPKSRRAQDAAAMDADDSDGAGSDAEDGANSSPALSQAATIGRPRPSRDGMVRLLAALVQALATHPVRSQVDVLEPIVQVLVQITRMPAFQDPATLDALGADVASIAVPAALAFKGLWGLCHGPASPEMDMCLQLVFRHMLTGILMKFQGLSSSSNVPRALQAVSETATGFVCRLLRDGVGVAMARTLVHHLCLGVVDRVEYRARVATAVSDVWLALPAAEAATLLPWLQKLSRNAKSCSRGFALDVAVELLQRPAISSHDSAAAILMDMLVSRASDKTPVVRTRALGSIATVTEAARQVQEQQGLLAAVEQAAFQAVISTPGSVVNDSMQGEASALQLVRHRTSDARGGVRRAALTALCAIMQLPSYTFDRKDIRSVHERCRDTVLSVRRQAMLSLTALLHLFPTQLEMQTLWLDGVMPLAIDREDTVKAKAIDTVADIILRGVQDEAHAPLAWALVDAIDRKQEMRCYVQRCCTEWAQKTVLTKAVVNIITKRVCAENSGWTLLAEVASRCPKLVNSTTVMETWMRGRAEGSCNPLVLTVLGSLALSATAAADLCTDLKKDIKRYALPASLVGVALSVITKMTEGGSTVIRPFFQEVLADVEQNLAACVLLKQADHAYSDDELSRRLFTLGDMALLCPGRLGDRSKLVLQGLIADSSSERVGVRAHAFLALGKLCLLDEALAKESLVMMSRELQDGTDPAARNNIVVVMSDLCVRYAALLEPHISHVAACLKDASPLVRRQTLMLLTRLLCEDYLKLKGSLFFRLASATVDADESVAQLAAYCLTESLHAKDATVFVSHFVECVFHFNACKAHPIFNQFPQTPQEEELFSLAGEPKRRLRMRIYGLMLQHCSDQDKLQLTHALCQDILAALVDGSLKLETASAVAADALAILASRDMKLHAHRAAAATESDGEDEAPLAKATAQLISKIAKKHLVQHIMPIIIGLKAALERVHSPLLGGLMLYLRTVLRDFKDEAEDILAADRQLATEILFDLQQFEQRRNTPSAATPVSAVPGSARPLVTPGTPFSAPRLRASVGSAMSATPLRFAPSENHPSTPRPPPLAWVRTPSSKAPKDDDIIHLKTPLQSSQARAVASPTFTTTTSAAAHAPPPASSLPAPSEAGRPRRSARPR